MDDGDTEVGRRDLRVTGLYARYGGKTYRVSGYSGGRFRGAAVLLISEDQAGDFAEIMSGEPLAAKVPLHELEGFVRINLRGRFAGRAVEILSIDDRTMHIVADAPLAWVREHGLKGSQHGGFWGDVPRDEVEVIGEEVRDLLLAEMRRKSKDL